MKKISLCCCILIIILGVLVSCGQEYDAETVSDVSVLQDGQAQYDLKFSQIADLIDGYAHVKGKRVKRGTTKYYKFLRETALNDSELQAIPEWEAVQIYIYCYDNETGSIEELELDDDKLPTWMTDTTIREYAENLGATPEELLKDLF